MTNPKAKPLFAITLFAMALQGCGGSTNQDSGSKASQGPKDSSGSPVSAALLLERSLDLAEATKNSALRLLAWNGVGEAITQVFTKEMDESFRRRIEALAKDSESLVAARVLRHLGLDDRAEAPRLGMSPNAKSEACLSLGETPDATIWEKLRAEDCLRETRVTAKPSKPSGTATADIASVPNFPESTETILVPRSSVQASGRQYETTRTIGETAATLSAEADVLFETNRRDSLFYMQMMRPQMAKNPWECLQGALLDSGFLLQQGGIRAAKRGFPGFPPPYGGNLAPSVRGRPGLGERPQRFPSRLRPLPPHRSIPRYRLAGRALERNGRPAYATGSRWSALPSRL